jgi:predicted phosphodiesterase
VRAISYGRPQPPLDRDFLSVQRDDGTKAPCNKVLKRVFAVSDRHTEYVANYDWCKALDSRNYQQDILIVAGDVCDDLDLLRETLSHLVERFARVFYTFGNHELWVRPIDKARGIETSWEKLQRVFEICESLNVCTHPEKIGELWVVPLHSWHHASFDDEPDIPDIPLASRLTISDYSACVWPEDLIKGNVSNGSYDIAAFIDSLNDRRDQWWGKLLEDRPNCDVISFSHFLPDMRLIPEKRFLFYPNLTKASGSLLLKERVALLHPDVHVFGHTHFAWDSKVGGTRYIQAPLCSPLERERRFQSICFANSPLSHHGKPVSASWLPLEIYSFTHSAPLEVTRAEEERNMGDQQQVSYQHPKNDPCDRLTQTSEAVHDNVHLNIQTGMDEQCMDNGDDPFSEELMRLDDGRIGEGGMLTRTMNDGRVQLRHGDCPEILGAHWSRYYELYARNPDNITLAPWVSGIYKRRRLKRKRSGS